MLECNVTNVGQKSCSLKKIIGEHMRIIRNNRKSSALALHTISTNNKINFENFRIFDTVNFKKQKEFVKMLNIHIYPNTINRM